jgi:hypothetical protein
MAKITTPNPTAQVLPTTAAQAKATRSSQPYAALKAHCAANGINFNLVTYTVGPIAVYGKNGNGWHMVSHNATIARIRQAGKNGVYANAIIGQVYTAIAPNGSKKAQKYGAADLNNAMANGFIVANLPAAAEVNAK